MPSSLMRKLNAMREGAPKPAARPSRPLIVRTHAEAADARLYSLPPAALRRLGYTGAAFHPERALFLDTETTGLAGAGTVAFLVGVGFVSNGVLTVRQYLMPDYAAEDELIDRLAELFTKFDTIVHFNGCTFDMPLLKGRFILRRRESDWREL
ncbi:MAG: ribonuclease H-like domain-containing protein, partial [Clostridia bacterium]|nr:ribonuclease H-like domain-containing protein [Clostridia bacterium]